MFQSKELEIIDKDYFHIIIINKAEVTVMSKNTHHIWCLHNTGYPRRSNCVIYHKHYASHPYHIHGKASSIKTAIQQIQKHDSWVLREKKGENNE